MITDNDFVFGNIKGSGLHYFDYANNGNIEIVPYAPSELKKILRRSALANYLYKNLQITGIKNLITLKFLDISTIDLVFFSVDMDNVDKDIVKRSYLAIDYFFEELKHLNIDYENILFILDGDRLRIYNGGDYQKSYHKHMSEYFMEKSKDNNIKFINLQPVFESDFSKNKTSLVATIGNLYFSAIKSSLLL